MKLRRPVTNRTSVVNVAGPTRAATTAPPSQLFIDWPRTPRRRRYTRQESIFPSDQRYGRVGAKRVLWSGL